MIVERTDPGDSEWEWIAPLHVHHQDDEAWYVLEGTLRFRIEDTVCEAPAGSAVSAPKGTPTPTATLGAGSALATCS